MPDEFTASHGDSSDRILGAGAVADRDAVPDARRRRRTDWRLGGRAISRWDLRVLLAVFLGYGVGIIGGILIARLATPDAPILSLAVLWVGLGGAVAYAFLRARPAGLLALKPVDILWGVGLGVALRLTQGLTSGSNSFPFPSADDGVNAYTQASLAAVLGPVIEEMFFRGVLVVVVYQLLRRSTGAVSAGLTAALLSTGVFVLVHAAFQTITLMDGIGLSLLSMTCSCIVLLTGRLWGAVLAHIVFNSVFVALSFLGSALG